MFCRYCRLRASSSSTSHSTSMAGPLHRYIETSTGGVFCLPRATERPRLSEWSIKLPYDVSLACSPDLPSTTGIFFLNRQRRGLGIESADPYRLDPQTHRVGHVVISIFKSFYHITLCNIWVFTTWFTLRWTKVQPHSVTAKNSKTKSCSPFLVLSTNTNKYDHPEFEFLQYLNKVFIFLKLKYSSLGCLWRPLILKYWSLYVKRQNCGQLTTFLFYCTALPHSVFEKYLS